ncbi:MAG: WG repeat-containing protein [Bacteroidota bacterium]
MEIFCYAQKTYETVFEKLNTTVGGCDFKVTFPPADPSTLDVAKSSKFDALDHLVLEASDSENLQSLLPDSIQAMLKNYRQTLPRNFDFYHKIKLDNGNFLQRKNKQWQLKDASGKSLTSSSFDYVVLDTFALGFVGYKNGKANYYDGENGKALLGEDYFHIEITGVREFIVQGIHGLGLMKDDKIIIAPHYEYLIPHPKEGRILYSIFNKKDRKTYLLLDDLQTFILQEPKTSDQYVGDHFLLKPNNLYNLKTGKKLLCEDKHGLQLVSEKHQLLQLHVAGEPVRWLIDFEGNFVAKIPLDRIRKFYGADYCIANYKEEPFKYNSKTSSGALSYTGQWIVPPQYDFIRKVGEYWLVLDMRKRQSGLLDSEGNEVIPIGEESISYIAGDQFLIGTKTGVEEEGISKLVDVKRETTLRENIPFLSVFNQFDICDKKYFVLSNGLKKNYLVNENFEELAGPFLEIYRYNDLLYGRDTRPAPVYQEKVRLDCDGKNVPFEVNGKKVESHRFWYRINDDLEYLNDMESNGYLIYQNKKVSPINFKYDMNTDRLRRFAHLYIFGTRNLGYGLFNSKGDVVIPVGIIDYIRPVRGGDGKQTIIRFKDKRTAILTAEGNFIGGQIFKYIAFINPGLYKVTTDAGKIGIINQYDEWVVPLGSAVSNTSGILKVNKNGAEFWYDVAGNRIK